MSDLFNTLPDGCFHMKGFLDETFQRLFLGMSRDLLKTHPLMTPTTRAGYPMALKVSSWGRVGWFGTNGRYEYMQRHMNGKEFPMIPQRMRGIFLEAAALAGFDWVSMVLDTVLLNWYPAGTGRLGKHQDVTEEDRDFPIVTFSLGDSCRFRVGSENYEDNGQIIQLDSGDCFVMGGPSRLAYHEVISLIPGSSGLLKGGGRISLTARQVFKR